jgi:outer membrane lipoprotein-sorting protein
MKKLILTMKRFLLNALLLEALIVTLVLLFLVATGEAATSRDGCPIVDRYRAHKQRVAEVSSKLDKITHQGNEKWEGE